MREIVEELAGADTRQPLVLILFDLDGFKLHNDTFGHPAGDSLLLHLAGSLEAAVAGRGRAYRMGGDEFCVIGSAARVGSGALIDAAAAALSEEGEGFAVTCSYRSVLLPDEANRVSDALRIADGRMYVHKNRHRPSAGRQSMDVLLRVLHERDSALGKHLAGVADLAEAVGRRLRIPAEQLETVRHAAELHDIGKVAIPEEILAKSGALTDDEVGFRPPAHADRRANPGRRARPGPGREARALDPRALRRHRLSGSAGRRPDPARRADHRRLRRVRRDDVGARIRARADDRGGAEGALPLRRHALRPAGGRGVLRGAVGAPRGARSLTGSTVPQMLRKLIEKLRRRRSTSWSEKSAERMQDKRTDQLDRVEAEDPGHGNHAAQIGIFS
jgi:diguanylate cyclase (GGDEF)-like protein